MRSTPDHEAQEIEMEVTPGKEEEKKGTDNDQRDMVRMGKEQETRVCKALPLAL